MLSDIIIAESDTGIAVFRCAACKQQFRALLTGVTTANKQPICLPCIEKANPERIKLGLASIPVNRAAYR